MKTTIKRTEKIDLATWDAMIQDMRRVLEAFKLDKPSADEVAEFLTSHMPLQDEKGAWGLVKPSEAPSDARVDYYYIPTYLSAAIMMRAYFDYPEVTERIEGFQTAFRKALQACTGRSFRGHGYGAMAGVLEAMRIFSDGGAVRILNDTTLCPDFSALIREQLAFIRESLATGRTGSEWGEDYASEYDEVMGRYRTLFVYGTLLKGQSNHDRYLSDHQYLGDAELPDFALFDLTVYPAILPRKGASVRGELYHVTNDDLRKIDQLEGEGTLYTREKIRIRSNGVNLPAETYVYHGNLDDSLRVPSEYQPWGMNNNCVWYACYGSNLLKARFMEYINGGNSKFTNKTHDKCKDTTPPVAEMTLEIPYELYFGNKSSSWDDGGVAFIDVDRPEKTLGRAYLITEEQYEHLRKQEGRGKNWYNHEHSLGDRYGIPVKTITNDGLREERAPSEKYKEVIILGLIETYGMGGGEAEEYVMKVVIGQRKP